jgi:hypothetical protein
MRILLLFLLLNFELLACSSPTARERMESIRDSARVQAAATGMDTFWMDGRSPKEKAIRPWEFYYKHCTLIDRKPFMDQAEYQCLDPY